ncbi:MAG TPA: DEAD/DEAH box helicase family protein, partial [Armatimonadota bacterium]|nr:DEAD/DEAH box helicase family protein [Armatimonadota bacterium]
MSARDDGPAAAQVQLRYYQEEAFAAVRYDFSMGGLAALLVLATGCGKTMTALSMAAATVRRGGRVLWVAHRSELVNQPLEAWRGLAQFHGAGEAGIVQGGTDDVGAAVIFASTGTIARGATEEGGRLGRIFDGADSPIRMVVIDECLPAGTP